MDSTRVLPQPFAAGTSMAVESEELLVPMPAMVRIDRVNVVIEDHPRPDATTVQLAVSYERLSAGRALTIAAEMVSIDGVLPAEITPDADGVVRIPVFAPEVFGNRVQWTVSDNLMVDQLGRGDGSLWPNNILGLDGGPQLVELGVAECWRFAQVVASLAHWFDVIERHMHATVDRLRATLNATDGPDDIDQF